MKVNHHNLLMKVNHCIIYNVLHCIQATKIHHYIIEATVNH